MAAITCDICGGALSMDSSGDFALCDSCGMKHTKDRIKAMAQEVTGTVAVSNQASIDSQMKRGLLALEDSKWKEADEFFDKVLDIDAEYAPAYIGKLCAGLRLKHESDLPEANTSDAPHAFKLFQAGDIFRAILSYRRGRKSNPKEANDYEKIVKNCSCTPLNGYPNFIKALCFADVDFRAKIENYAQLHKKFINNFDKFHIETIAPEYNKLLNLQKVAAKNNTTNKITATIKQDGTISVSGNYASGEYGEDTSEWENIVEVVTGRNFVIASTAGGGIKAAGCRREYKYYDSIWNSYKLLYDYKGSGGDGDKNWFSLGSLLNAPIAIAAGADHVVGLYSDGSVDACGRNDHKQCEISYSKNWKDIVAIAAFDDCTIGVRVDGSYIVTGKGFDNTIYKSEEEFLRALNAFKEKEQKEREQQAEQDRIERERREEKERKEKEEKERREEREKIEKAEQERREAKRIRIYCVTKVSVILSCIGVYLYIFLFGIIRTSVLGDWVDVDDFFPIAGFSLVLGIIGFFFRNDPPSLAWFSFKKAIAFMSIIQSFAFWQWLEPMAGGAFAEFLLFNAIATLPGFILASIAWRMNSMTKS